MHNHHLKQCDGVGWQSQTTKKCCLWYDFGNGVAYGCLSAGGLQPNGNHLYSGKRVRFWRGLSKNIQSIPLKG